MPVNPITPTYGGVITVPLYDAPYTLPVSVSHGGPVFMKNSLSPIVTWDTSGYWCLAFSANPNQSTIPTNAYFNCIECFPENYSGSSNNQLVNGGGTSFSTNFSGCNGLLYGISAYQSDQLYYYAGSLLTPYYDGNATGLFQEYPATNIWRPTSGSNEKPVGTFTAIAPAVSNTEPIKFFQVAWQFSGTVGEDCIYIAGSRLFQNPPADITGNCILSSGPSGSYPDNPPATSSIFAGSPPENLAAIWYNQTAANDFQGGYLPVTNMPNIIMTTYVDNVNLCCFHLYGYNPAASYNSMTGQWVPALNDCGAFLVPGITSGTNQIRNPDAFCGFGFFWQTSPNSGIVLTPEGTTYYTIDFVGESTNAIAALASGYTSIMSDGNNVFWLVTYTLSSNSFYVANGQAYLETIGGSAEISPGVPLSLPCYVPCTFGNSLGQNLGGS